MSDKLDKHKIEELREMVKDKDPNRANRENPCHLLLTTWTFHREHADTTTTF